MTRRMFWRMSQKGRESWALAQFKGWKTARKEDAQNLRLLLDSATSISSSLSPSCIHSVCSLSSSPVSGQSPTKSSIASLSPDESIHCCSDHWHWRLQRFCLRQRSLLVHSPYLQWIPAHSLYFTTEHMVYAYSDVILTAAKFLLHTSQHNLPCCNYVNEYTYKLAYMHVHDWTQLQVWWNAC